MIPAAFQTRSALKVLNVGAFGLALAAVTSAMLAGLDHDHGLGSIVSGIPTLVIGAFWAWVLRIPKTVGKTTFRWGWALSMPLAILNASVATGLLFMLERSQHDAGRFLMGAVLGATVGAIVWFPALVATVLCFGLPIAWAQRLAAKGLAGEERGEWIIGVVCTVMSVLGLLVSLATQGSGAAATSAAAMWMTRGFAVLGALAAASSTGLAFAREARRRRFVADAEAGKIAGYRIDATDEGKVLVRVVAQGKGYRVADFEEELFELDAEGEARRPKTLAADARGA